MSCRSSVSRTGVRARPFIDESPHAHTGRTLAANSIPGGSFTGDGIRLLGWGTNADGNGLTEYWLSSDGRHWTKLALTGNAPTSSAGYYRAFLMRDGVLFSTDSGNWFGDPVTKYTK